MVDEQAKVGPRGPYGDGVTHELRSSKTGSQVTTDAHGRFYEAASRGLLYTGGMLSTSISAATFTTATTDGTATPIIGLWNPLTSGKNAILLQAYLCVSQTALQATGPGAFSWMYTRNESAISTGSTPIGTNTFVAGGSSMKFYAGTALTGKSTALAIFRGSSMGSGSAIGAAFLATQAGAQTVQNAAIEHIDGSIVVPPGGVIGLFCSITPVGHSASSGLLWEEQPV